MNSKFVAVKTSQSVYREHYGIFDTLDDAWSWINSKDPRRQQEWYVLTISDKEKY